MLWRWPFEIRQSPSFLSLVYVPYLVLFLSILQSANAKQPGTSPRHHMNQIRRTSLVSRQSQNTPLIVTNQCGQTIYPGVLSQSGGGPGTGGFALTSGSSKTMMVAENWQGRVWGRTNCSFNSDGTGSASGTGQACTTGDCGGIIDCQGAVIALECTLAQRLLIDVLRDKPRRVLLNSLWIQAVVRHSTIFR